MKLLIAGIALAVPAAVFAARGAQTSRVGPVPRTPDGHPDLQGVWSRKYNTRLQRPVEFAEREFFTEAEAAELARRGKQDQRAIVAGYFYDTPDDDVESQEDGLTGPGGIALAEFPGADPARPTSLIIDPPNGRMPPLTPEAQRRFDALNAQWQSAPANPEERDLSNRCLLDEGPSQVGPLLFGLSRWNRQIVQTPGYVMVALERNHELQVIPVDGRPHLPPQIRTRMGDARGQWDGDTLVVETTNFDVRGRFADERIRVVERYTRTDADTIRYEFTVEDPAYTRPYTVRLALRPSGPIFEYACHEGNYAMSNILAGARMAERLGATISGVVHEVSGRPVAGVKVEARALVYHKLGYVSLQSAVAGTTNERGEYRLFPVPAGEYFLQATSSATALGSPPGTPTFLSGDTRVGASTPLTVREREAVMAAPMTLAAVNRFTLSGRVLRSPDNRERRGQGAPSNVATIRGLRLAFNDASESADDPAVRVTIDQSTGAFDIHDVPPGTYQLSAAVDDVQNWLLGGASRAIAMTTVTVTDRDMTGLALSTRPGIDVHGKIRLDGPLSDGTPVHVALQPMGATAKNPLYKELAQRPVIASADGSFTIPAVLAGRFRFLVRGLPGDQYVADIVQNGVSVLDRGVDLGPEPAAPIEIVAKRGATTVRGTVRDVSGRLMPGATVTVAPERARFENLNLHLATTSDGAGRFTIAGVAPGAYTLFAWEQRVWGGASQSARFLAAYQDRGRPVVVAEGTSVAVDVTAIPAQR